MEIQDLYIYVACLLWTQLVVVAHIYMILDKTKAFTAKIKLVQLQGNFIVVCYTGCCGYMHDVTMILCALSTLQKKIVKITVSTVARI